MKGTKTLLPSVVRQATACLQGWTTGILFGTSLGYMSAGLDSFQRSFESGNAPFKLENVHVGTMGSSMNIGGIFGAICSGFIARKFGRKRPCILLLAFHFIGWGLIAFPKNFTMMLTGQIICGFGQGFRAPIGRMYLGEVAHPAYRGRFLSSILVIVQSAQLVVYIAALFLSWQPLAIMCGLAPLLFLPAVFKAPESHVWLIMQGREDEARKSLQWLYGEDYNIDKDFEEALSHHKTTKDALGSWRDVLTFQYLKPVLILAVFITLRRFCGGTIIQMLMSQIFRRVSTEGSLDTRYCIIILGFVQLACLSLAGWMMDKIGRRKCVVISGVMMGIFEAAAGAFFYLREEPSTEYLTHAVPWMPLVLLSLSMVGFGLGLSSIMFVLLGELIPIQIKNEANGFLNVTNSASGAVSMISFHYMLESLDTSGTFWIFSACSFLVVVFLVNALPETKGESLGMIERKMTGTGSLSVVRDDEKYS